MDTISDHQTESAKPTGSLANNLTLNPSSPNLELMNDAPWNSLESSETCSLNSDELTDYHSASSCDYDNGSYNDMTSDLITQLDAIELPLGVGASMPLFEQPLQSPHLASSANFSQINSQAEMKMKGKIESWSQQQPSGNQFKVSAMKFGVEASPATSNTTIPRQMSSHGVEEIEGKASVWWQQQQPPFMGQFMNPPENFNGVDPTILWPQPPVQVLYPAAASSSAISTQFVSHNGKEIKGWKQHPFGSQVKVSTSEIWGVEPPIPHLEQPIQFVQQVAPNYSIMPNQFNFHGQKGLMGNSGAWWQQQPHGSQFAAPAAAAQFGELEAINRSMELAMENVYSAALSNSNTSSNLSPHGEMEIQGKAGVWWQQPFESQYAGPAAAYFEGVEAADFSVQQFMDDNYSTLFHSSTMFSNLSSHGEKEMNGEAEDWWNVPLGGHFPVVFPEFDGVDASIPWLELSAQYAYHAPPNSSPMFDYIGRPMSSKAQIWQQQQHPLGSQVTVPTPNVVSVEASIPWLAHSVQPQHLAIPKNSTVTSHVSFHGENKMKGKAEVLEFDSHVLEKKMDVLQQNAESQKEAESMDSLIVAGQSSSRNNEVEDDLLEKFRLFKKFDVVQDHLDHNFTQLASKSMQATRNWTKTIQQEWNSLEKDLPDGIFVRVYEERMDLLRAVIVGPEGTPYQSGLFFFDVFFPPNYPNTPPLVFYHSGGLRLNPNLYNCGKVCLSLLNTWAGDKDEQWIPGHSSVLQLLLSIQALVLNEKPYFNEPGYEVFAGDPQVEYDSDSYSEDAFILSCKTMVYLLRKPPKHFEVFVAGHFREKAHAILQSFRACLKGSYRCSKIHVESVAKDKLPLSKRYFPILQMLVQEFTSNGAKDCEQFLIP